MEKHTEKTSVLTERDETAQVVADLFGVTADYVRKVLRGERQNDMIIKICYQYKTEKSRLLNQLKKALKT
jgi:hypothetical protein